VRVCVCVCMRVYVCVYVSVCVYVQEGGGWVGAGSNGRELHALFLYYLFACMKHVCTCSFQACKIVRANKHVL